MQNCLDVLDWYQKLLSLGKNLVYVMRKTNKKTPHQTVNESVYFFNLFWNIIKVWGQKQWSCLIMIKAIGLEKTQLKSPAEVLAGAKPSQAKRRNSGATSHSHVLHRTCPKDKDSVRAFALDRRQNATFSVTAVFFSYFGL